MQYMYVAALVDQYNLYLDACFYYCYLIALCYNAGARCAVALSVQIEHAEAGLAGVCCAEAFARA